MASNSCREFQFISMEVMICSWSQKLSHTLRCLKHYSSRWLEFQISAVHTARSFFQELCNFHLFCTKESGPIVIARGRLCDELLHTDIFCLIHLKLVHHHTTGSGIAPPPRLNNKDVIGQSWTCYTKMSSVFLSFAQIWPYCWKFRLCNHNPYPKNVDIFSISRFSSPLGWSPPW